MVFSSARRNTQSGVDCGASRPPSGRQSGESACLAAACADEIGSGAERDAITRLKSVPPTATPAAFRRSRANCWLCGQQPSSPRPILPFESIRRLSHSVPIVGASLNSPVAVGLVASLSRLGGNVTGVSTMADELVFKSIETMREISPQTRNVTIVFNPTNSSNPVMLEALTRQLAHSGLAINSVPISSSADLDAAFDQVSQQHPGALVVLTDNSLLGLGEMIVARAMAQRVPVFASMSYAFSGAGELLNYSRDPEEAFRAVARLLKRILDGSNPADLPVEQPTKFVLSINLRTAKALGISIPPSLPNRADEVIE